MSTLFSRPFQLILKPAFICLSLPRFPMLRSFIFIFICIIVNGHFAEPPSCTIPSFTRMTQTTVILYLKSANSKDQSQFGRANLTIIQYFGREDGVMGASFQWPCCANSRCCASSCFLNSASSFLFINYPNKYFCYVLHYSYTFIALIFEDNSIFSWTSWQPAQGSFCRKATVNKFSFFLNASMGSSNRNLKNVVNI